MLLRPMCLCARGCKHTLSRCCEGTAAHALLMAPTCRRCILHHCLSVAVRLVWDLASYVCCEWL